MEKNHTYFESYNDISVHALMINDKPRTLSYFNFLQQNAEIFKGKVVIDVGSGTGILSLFVAKVGAKKVYAIEKSDIALISESIISVNGFDSCIEVINETVEETSKLDGVSADIIISEWMGFYLLHESMLSSVLIARDRWLKHDGLIFPSHASLQVCPVNTEEYYKAQYEMWKDVYGFDFTPIIPLAVYQNLQKPAILSLTPEQLAAEETTVLDFDLSYVTQQELKEVNKKLEFSMLSNCKVHGFALWFTVEFNVPAASNPVSLSSSPRSEPTHWKQTVVMLPAPLLVEKGDTVSCRVNLTQDTANTRWYNISVDVILDETDSSISEDDLDGEDHVMPCDCDAPRCRIIRAVSEKYDEQDRMLNTTDIIDISSSELEAVDKEYDANDSTVTLTSP